MKVNIRSRLPNLLVLLADIIITIVAITAAFAIRLAGDTVTDYIGSLYWMILISLLLKPAIYYFFGLYRRLPSLPAGSGEGGTFTAPMPPPFIRRSATFGS
jgi:hypothetical protein